MVMESVARQTADIGGAELECLLAERGLDALEEAIKMQERVAQQIADFTRELWRNICA